MKCNQRPHAPGTLVRLLFPVRNDWQVTAMDPAVDHVAAVRRHSAMVWRLRRVLPLMAALCIGWILLTSVMSRPTDSGLSLGAAILSSNALIMEQPHLIGYLPNARSYEVTARRATQQFSKPDELDLSAINARISVSARDWTSVRASKGSYNRIEETLRLDGDIEVQASSGYTAKLTGADVNLKTGAMISQVPVKIVSANGTIDANGVEISDSGAHVKFFNGVQMTLQPSVRRR